MKKLLKRILIIIPVFYVVVCALLYFFQENIIFLPEKLKANYRFKYDQNFEERSIRTKDGLRLNGLLFKADSSKGLIFYLHGNGGSLRWIGDVAKTYTNLDYDVFILDYRGYGKSEGVINNENDLYDDNQMAYDALKKEYDEKNIIILGYSIGSGMAAELASTNSPKKLVLEAPYYNLTYIMKRRYRIIPTFLLKYKFATNDYLKSCKMPIYLFHGTDDNSTYYESSLKLKKDFSNKLELITLKDQGHNGIPENETYLRELKRILSQ
jgi:uncharacterized protein